MATALKLPTGLWPHQKEAIKTIHAYLSDSEAEETTALLTLPTGTGKSGVIGPFRLEWGAATAPIGAFGRVVSCVRWSEKGL